MCIHSRPLSLLAGQGLERRSRGPFGPASRGRRYLVESEQGERLYLVTCDRVPARYGGLEARLRYFWSLRTKISNWGTGHVMTEFPDRAGTRKPCLYHTTPRKKLNNLNMILIDKTYLRSILEEDS